MNLYPTIKMIFDRRKNATSKKKGVVELEIYFQRRRKWIATGISVLPRNWNDRKRVVGLAESNELNLRLEALESMVMKCIRQLMMEDRPFTWDVIDNLMEDRSEHGSFIRFVEKRVDDRKDIRESTRKNHRKFVVALKEFKRIDRFSDLTKSNILRYDEWLRGRKTYTQATIASYHKFMKIYVNEALRNESISINPYEGIRIDRGKSQIRKYLTEGEIKAIEAAELPTRSLEKTRDVFLFQCFTDWHTRISQSLISVT